MKLCLLRSASAIQTSLLQAGTGRIKNCVGPRILGPCAPLSFRPTPFLHSLRMPSPLVDDMEPGSALDMHKRSIVDAFVRNAGGKRPIQRILIASNHTVAATTIASLRHWADMTLGDEKALDLVVMAAEVEVNTNTDGYVEGPSGSDKNNVDLIVSTAEKENVDAVWPDWGDASENSRLATALTSKGIVFIGPTASVTAALEDKISANILAQSAHVPVLPWSVDGIESGLDEHGVIPKEIFDKACVFTADQAAEIADKIGYPVMIASSAGGGGKGIREVTAPEDLRSAFQQVLNEVPESPIYMTQFCADFVHIEVQIIGDELGNAVALYDRDCFPHGERALPSKDTYFKMMQAAKRLVQSFGYIGTGTVTFLWQPSPSGDKFYFLKLNPHSRCDDLDSMINLPSVQLQLAMGVEVDRIPKVRDEYLPERSETVTVSEEVSALPFVDRDSSMRRAAAVLKGNLKITRQSDPNAQKSLALMVLGQMYGSGKSAFATNLPRYLRPALELEHDVTAQQLVVVSVPSTNQQLTSYFGLWEKHILKQPDMSELQGFVNSAMSCDVLVDATSKYLLERGLVLYLHLDEFIPDITTIRRCFLDKESWEEVKRNELTGIDIFYGIWRDTLVKLQTAQNILLILTGKCAYYDTIGHLHLNSPSRVHKPALELLGVRDVRQILDLSMLKQECGEPMSVAAVLQSILSVPADLTKEQAVDKVAECIQDLTGGVPRLIEAVLRSILEIKRRVMSSARTFMNKVSFKKFMYVLSLSELEKMELVQEAMAGPKGVLLETVKEMTKEERMRQYINLHNLFLACTAPVQCSIIDYQTANANAAVSALLNTAQYWGVYHTYQNDRLQFVIPQLFKQILLDCSDPLTIKVKEELSVTEADASGQQYEQCIRNSLVLDRWQLTMDNGQECLVEKLMQRHFNKHGLFAKQLDQKSAMEVKSSYLYHNLPKLGKNGRGTLRDMQETMLTNGAFLHESPPTVFVQLVGSLNSLCQVFVPAARSPCADIMVRHRNIWLHFQVKDVEGKIAALQEVSKICGNVIKYCIEPDFLHIIVLSNRKRSTHDDMCGLRDLLLDALEDPARNLKTPIQKDVMRKAIAHTFGVDQPNGSHAYGGREELSEPFEMPPRTIDARILAIREKMQPKTGKKKSEYQPAKVEQQWLREEASREMIDTILQVMVQHDVQAVGLSLMESEEWSRQGALSSVLIKQSAIVSSSSAQSHG